jgi:acetyl-CoA acetyltransferase
MLGNNACISGVGRSEVGRNLGRDPLDLAIEASINALDDAGLERTDIDGIAAYVPDDGSTSIGDLQMALGLEVDWFLGCLEGPSQLEALWAGVMAVATGRATHVLAFHSSCEGSVRSMAGRGGSLPGTARMMPSRARGPQTDWLPFGAPSAANIISMYARRHFHEFGTSREQLAQIALVERANAALNTDAIFREPLDMESYLNARMVSDPLCLYDCDVPVDFALAVLVSRADATSGLRKKPIMIDTVSTARRALPSWSQGVDVSTMLALHDVGSALWRSTTLVPSDVDVAGIYDGLSFIALNWIEALGFCARGEGGSFLEGGARIALDGELPLNPHGGQLSAGRKHGWEVVPEVCLQLWGEAGPRQVGGRVEVGIIAAGGGVSGSAALLTC